MDLFEGFLCKERRRKKICCNRKINLESRTVGLDQATGRKWYENGEQTTENHWHKWKLLYLNGGIFAFVWKRYWPLYSFEYIGKRQPSDFGFWFELLLLLLLLQLVIMIICYSSLILLKEKCIRALSERDATLFGENDGLATRTDPSSSSLSSSICFCCRRRHNKCALRLPLHSTEEWLKNNFSKMFILFICVHIVFFFVFGPLAAIVCVVSLRNMPDFY